MSKTTDRALNLLRYLPRVCLGNIRNNPGSTKVISINHLSNVPICVHLRNRGEAEVSMEVTTMAVETKVLHRDKILCD